MPYQFKKDEQTKFKTWGDYIQRKINPWAWLIVEEQKGDKVVVSLQENRSVKLEVPLAELAVPFGWEEIYDVVVPDVEKAKMVQSWMVGRGGISVWTCQDLSQAGRTMYTPGDKKDEKPHWSMGFVEVVTDPKRIRIMLTETSSEKKDQRDKDNGWRYDRGMREWIRLVPWEENA
jgi:hypothetical protein